MATGNHTKDHAVKQRILEYNEDDCKATRYDQTGSEVLRSCPGKADV